MLNPTVLSVAAPTELTVAMWVLEGAAAFVVVPLAAVVFVWLVCCGLKSRRDTA
jgi:hypothetical protein